LNGLVDDNGDKGYLLSEQLANEPLTITDEIEELDSKFGPRFHVGVIRQDGTKVKLQPTPWLGKEIIALYAAEALPTQATIVSFPTSYGNNGYKLAFPGEED
jgi:hypothetical protein